MYFLTGVTEPKLWNTLIGKRRTMHGFYFILVILAAAVVISIPLTVFARRHRHEAEEAFRKARDELERRDEDLTAELVKANEQLKKEIEENEATMEALKASLVQIGRAKREWESTVDSIPQLICLIDNHGAILRANRTVEQWTPWQVRDVKGRTIHELFHPGCTAQTCYLGNFWPQAWNEVTAGRSAEHEADDKVMERCLHLRVRPILNQIYRKGEEITSYAVMVAEDITERKRAEKEAAALEEKLHQSQKMKTIDRVTSSIAHDFSNWLTPIVEYMQLAIGALSPLDPMRNDLQTVKQSAERAANLIRQMMTFSRRRPTNLQAVNLNNLLLDMEKPLHSLIGQHIKLVPLPGTDLGSVKVDPTQFEQIFINLAANARDAMPKGGKLIIETRNITLNQDYVYQHVGMTPGKYVMLAVSDEGIGMTPEVKAHLFEPFFTTKETSGGAGLGLATVYGIVKKVSGHILIYSEPGQGTTFKIYLPRIEEEPSRLPHRDEVGYLPKGKETVLLVEDEPLVRSLAARVLRQQGYNVLEAPDGAEGMATAREHAREEVHLLLADVVMPKMGGRELAERLKSLWPDIKVLFTSGYTYNAITQHGLLDPEMAFLEKPFSISGLVRKVREVLDR
jgi:two-component system cell cycle sensor histidine kinase/response regulator CckA